MFTALCVSYGAGDRFITTLNHRGCTISGKAFLSFLDWCLNAKKHLYSQKIGDTLPIILLMDNIDMYRGKKKHLHLLNKVAWTNNVEFYWQSPDYTKHVKLEPPPEAAREMA